MQWQFLPVLVWLVLISMAYKAVGQQGSVLRNEWEAPSLVVCANQIVQVVVISVDVNSGGACCRGGSI